MLSELIFAWNSNWPFWARDIVALVLALLIAQVVYSSFYALLRGIAARRSSYLGKSLVRNTQRPARALLMIFALSAVLPGLALPVALDVPVHHALEIAFIICLTWLTISIVTVVDELIHHRLPFDIGDNLQARRIRTQVQLLRRILVGVIVFGGVAAALMTFPTIRSVGAGLFASAGLAGLAVGMAARPALGNLIAGMQIALTEPIRIDDVVIVEGEWGRVEEVTTTYVVVRIWDLRRMIVPLTYFIEKPFQNWTRSSADLLGTVFLHTDYSVPVQALRDELGRILDSASQWDRKVNVLQVTDSTERTMEIRCLMSAADSGILFDLRCIVRERMLAFLQQNYPGSLPRIRADVELPRNGGAPDELPAGQPAQ
jgi:small-conductance mechanosensitive channel